MKRTIALVFLIGSLTTAWAQSQRIDPVLPISPRIASLGGPHAAFTVGLDAIFENPAGFASEVTVFSAARLSLNTMGPIFDIANLLLSGDDPLTELPSILDAAGRLYVGSEIVGPVAFGFTGQGLGFGVFNRTVAIIDAVSLLTASMSVTEELLITGGYAHRLLLGGGHVMDLGIMPKAFFRGELTDSGTTEDMIDMMMDPTSLLGSTPFSVVTGIGFDAGALWTSPFGLAAGLVARDAYSPAMVSEYANFEDFLSGVATSPSAALVRTDISLGLSYVLPFRFLADLGMDVTVMADYTDFLDFLAPVPRNAILKFSAGLEVSMLDILFVRAGIRDALPSAGFSVDLSWFHFDLAMYGRELGLEPGARPVFNLLASLDFEY